MPPIGTLPNESAIHFALRVVSNTWAEPTYTGL